MGSSACALLCLILFTFQGLSGTEAGDCQDVLGGSVQVRLNDSITTVNKLGWCLGNFSTDIAEIELLINPSTPCAVQKTDDPLQEVINARIYLTYAVNLALQANMSVCIAGWQDQFQTIYDAASARVAAANNLYLSVVNSVAALKVQLSVDVYSQTVVQLNACAALNTPRIDLIQTCLSGVVYSYTQFIYALQVEIAVLKQQALLLKQGPNYGLLEASIDASVSIALYSIKGYAEYILTCAGVSAEAVYNTAVNEISAINVRYRLDSSAVNLESDILNYVNYLYQLKDTVTATVNSNATLATIANLIAPLNATAGVVVILSPQLASNITQLLQQGQNLVNSAIDQLNANYDSFVSSVYATVGSSLSIYDNYNALIASAQANLTACLPECIDARLTNVEESSACIHAVLANFDAMSNQTNTQLANIVSQINSLTSTSPFDVQTQFGYINDWAVSTSVQLLSTLNFTINNDISLQICGYLNTTYTNAVSNDFNTIIEKAGIVTNITSTYQSNLEAVVATTLQPIRDAIALITKVKPYYDVSGIVDSYNALYNQLVTGITNYLNSIAANVTDLSNVDVRFNLGNNFTKLCQDLANCVQSVTTELTTSNFVGPFNCFVPILLDFNTLLNTIIGSVQVTVNDISVQANTTQTVVIDFIGTTLTNGSATATTIEQTALNNASITTDAQVNATVVNITLAKQEQIDGIIGQIQGAINTLLSGNLQCLANVSASAQLAVQPWILAVNFSLLNYPNYTQQINAEFPKIDALINTTLSNISTAVAPFLSLSAEQSAQIQNQLQACVDDLNLNLLNYSAANLTTRCSDYSSQPYNYSSCLTAAYNEMYTYLTTVAPSKFNEVLQSALDIMTSICGNITNTVNSVLNVTQTTAVTQGIQLIQTYNVSTSQIISKTMGALSSYNITPIMIYSKSIDGFANTILSRQLESINSGNYTISTTTYVIYDAVGSVMYLTYWYSSFPNETALANQVVNTARQEVLALFPYANAQANDIKNVSLQINITLINQINLLNSTNLNISCGQYNNTESYYDLYVCINQLLSSFGAYYNNTLKDCATQNSLAYKTVLNVTAQFNSWLQNIIVPKAAQVVESLKPIAEKLINDNNCTVSKLIGYALHIMTDRYNEYKPQIVAAAVQINATAANVTARNYTGIYSLEPNITNYMIPLTTVISLIQNSSNTSLLTPDVLAAPQTFYNSTVNKFNIYLANFTWQATNATNATVGLLQNVETSYAALTYDYIYNFCYNASNTYPKIDLVNCYNQHHYGFMVYLLNILTTAKKYVTQLTNLYINYVSLITNYATKTLLPSYKNDVGLYAARLYVAANMTVPPELQLLLTITKDCVVPIFTPAYQCLIYK